MARTFFVAGACGALLVPLGKAPEVQVSEDTWRAVVSGGLLKARRHETG